jgi:hypothetical protein
MEGGSPNPSYSGLFGTPVHSAHRFDWVQVDPSCGTQDDKAWGGPALLKLQTTSRSLSDHVRQPWPVSSTGSKWILRAALRMTRRGNEPALLMLGVPVRLRWDESAQYGRESAA